MSSNVNLIHICGHIISLLLWVALFVVAYIPILFIPFYLAIALYFLFVYKIFRRTLILYFSFRNFKKMLDCDKK